VERDDPLLFLADSEFVDVVEQLMGVDPAAAAQAFAGARMGHWQGALARPAGSPHAWRAPAALPHGSQQPEWPSSLPPSHMNRHHTQTTTA
jgi:hypothetical protein